MRRIRHLKVVDNLYNLKLNNVILKIKNKELNFDNPNIIDLIEFFHIKLFFDDALRCNVVDGKVLIEYKDVFKNINKILSKHFYAIDITTIKSDLQFVNASHLEEKTYTNFDYFNAFSSFFNFENKDKTYLLTFLNFLNINRILTNKKFFDGFESEIKDFLIEYKHTFQIIVRNNETIYLPEFNDREIYTIVTNYLNGEQFELKILKEAFFHKNSNKSYKLNNEDRAAILEKLKSLDMNITLDKQYIHSLDLDVSFFEEFIKNEMVISDLSLSERNDGILAILIEYANLINKDYLISNAVVRNFEKPLLEMIFNKSNNEFHSFNFEIENKIDLIILNSIVKELDKNKIAIEDILNWFLKDNINNLLENYEIKLSLTSSDSLCDKCLSLFVGIESLLKQFYFYINKQENIKEYILRCKSSVRIEDYPSLVTNKYYELANSKEIEILKDLLFGSNPIDNNNIYLKYETLYDLILSNTFNLNECDYFAQKQVKYLVKKGILKLKNGIVYFKNDEVKMLWSIIKDDSCIPAYISADDKLQLSINKYLKQGWLVKSNKLFTNKEAAYLNYVLNSSEFSDSLSLRNLYAHGNAFCLEEKEMRIHYLIGLRTLFQVLLKIYYDLLINKNVDR